MVSLAATEFPPIVRFSLSGINEIPRAFRELPARRREFSIQWSTAFAYSLGRVSVLIVEKVNCLIGLARGLQIAGRPRPIVFEASSFTRHACACVGAMAGPVSKTRNGKESRFRDWRAIKHTMGEGEHVAGTAVEMVIFDGEVV